MKYNRIAGPKVSVADYIKTLSNDELMHMYKSTFFSELKLGTIHQYVKDEMLVRNISVNINTTI